MVLREPNVSLLCGTNQVAFALNTDWYMFQSFPRLLMHPTNICLCNIYYYCSLSTYYTICSTVAHDTIHVNKHNREDYFVSASFML